MVTKAFIILQSTIFSSEKRQWGDQKAVVRKQTAQCCLGQASNIPKGIALGKDFAGRVTLLLLFPRKALARRARYVA
jgi:hypothetical protein